MKLAISASESVPLINAKIKAHGYAVRRVEDVFFVSTKHNDSTVYSSSKKNDIISYLRLAIRGY